MAIKTKHKPVELLPFKLHNLKDFLIDKFPVIDPYLEEGSDSDSDPLLSSVAESDISSGSVTSLMFSSDDVVPAFSPGEYPFLQVADPTFLPCADRRTNCHDACDFDLRLLQQNPDRSLR